MAIFRSLVCFYCKITRGIPYNVHMLPRLLVCEAHSHVENHIHTQLGGISAAQLKRFLNKSVNGELCWRMVTLVRTPSWFEFIPSAIWIDHFTSHTFSGDVRGLLLLWLSISTFLVCNDSLARNVLVWVHTVQIVCVYLISELTRGYVINLRSRSCVCAMDWFLVC